MDDDETGTTTRLLGQTLIEIAAFICLILVGVGVLIYLTTR